MKSNKQKRNELKARRDKKKHKQKNTVFRQQLAKGSVIRANPAKLVTHSLFPDLPAFYRDLPFVCVDCGAYEVWTAKQQQWWYEEAGGAIETTAIRCRPCRRRERERKAAARKAYFDGMARKSTSH